MSISMTMLYLEIDEIQKHIRKTFHSNRDQMPDIDDALFQFTLERFVVSLQKHRNDSLHQPQHNLKFFTSKDIRRIVWTAVEGTDPMHVASRILDLCFPQNPGILVPTYRPFFYYEHEAEKIRACNLNLVKMESLGSKLNQKSIAPAVEMISKRVAVDDIETVEEEDWFDALDSSS
ncbi:hypothetical protein HDU78_006556 [Chytriomyces hyalinus]|nr:hypothetical protein HDU78_006556 [Chytriomyces hyalinus]KAJ3262422.1 hypothetical protein HDU77_000340 [Chytriomyces hyalinus]